MPITREFITNIFENPYGRGVDTGVPSGGTSGPGVYVPPVNGKGLPVPEPIPVTAPPESVSEAVNTLPASSPPDNGLLILLGLAVVALVIVPQMKKRRR